MLAAVDRTSSTMPKIHTGRRTRSRRRMNRTMVHVPVRRPPCSASWRPPAGADDGREVAPPAVSAVVIGSRRRRGQCPRAGRSRPRSGGGTAPPASVAGSRACGCRTGRGAAARRRAGRCRRRTWPAPLRATGLWIPGSASSPVTGRSVSTAIAVRVRWRSSASVPCSTVWPARMIVTRSHRASTWARMWLDSRTVRPSSMISRMVSWKIASISGSRPDVGSSRMSSSASGRERGDERDLLPVALRVRAPLLRRVELEPVEELVAPAPVEPAPELPEQVDHLAPRQVGPQRDVAGDVGEAAVEGDGVVPRVAVEQGGVARVGPQQAEQNPDGGGLPGAVGPEEAVDLARGDLEVEVVEGEHVAERLGQPGDGDGGHDPTVTSAPARRR